MKVTIEIKRDEYPIKDQNGTILDRVMRIRVFVDEERDYNLEERIRYDDYISNFDNLWKYLGEKLKDRIKDDS